MGDRPDDATNRLTDDRLVGWTRRVRGWDPVFLEAIDRGLAFKKAERPQTVAEWRELLSADSPAAKQESKHWGSFQWRPTLVASQAAFRRVDLRWAVAVTVAMALTVGIYWYRADDLPPTKEPLAAEQVENIDESAARRIEAALAADGLDEAEALLAELNPDYPQWSALAEAVDEARRQTQQSAAVARLVAEAKVKVADNEPVVAALRDGVAQLREALTLDPGSVDAKAGLQAVQDRYVALVDDALSAALPKRAEQWIRELEHANSSHPELRALRERTTSIARQTALASKIGTLLRAANAKLSSNQLMLPQGDNAVADFRGVLALDPDNAEARAGLAAVEARYVELIRDAVLDDAPERGRRLLATLMELNPRHPDAPRLDADIDAAEVREVPPPALTPPQPASGVAQTVSDEEDELWNSVKDSCRNGDLERYCNRYLNGRHVEACWLKLSECLRHRATGSR